MITMIIIIIIRRIFIQDIHFNKLKTAAINVTSESRENQGQSLKKCTSVNFMAFLSRFSLIAQLMPKFKLSLLGSAMSDFHKINFI